MNEWDQNVNGRKKVRNRRMECKMQKETDNRGGAGKLKVEGKGGHTIH